MSIFKKHPINVGDLVIGINKYGFDNIGSPHLRRYFDEPSLVLEIKEETALVFLEHQGPVWYNLSKLERCYVKDEFEHVNRRVLASNQFNHSDQSGDKDDAGDK